MQRARSKSFGKPVVVTLIVGWTPFGWAELPVPCGGGICGGGPSVWITSGQASRNINGNTLEIQQQTDRAILNWATFNVSADSKVKFDQPAATSVALNRIFDQQPSSILGSIEANGQIYLINPNGILFGDTARINTNSLIASTLDVDDAIFDGPGIGQAINQGNGLPAFQGGNLGTITIDTGAQIEAQSGGRVFIFAPEIVNRGTIHTPDGQAMLAASQDKVYLQASNDPLLRGFLVEVDTGGSVENLGTILAERGNVTLAGLAVNQGGRVTATTSLQSAGTVRLLARDSVSIETVGTNRVLVPQESGTLTLAPNSITEVLPDPTATGTAVDDQPQPHSRIELMGREIHIGQDARIEAKSGDVSVIATTNPRVPVLNPDTPIAPNVAQNDSRLVIDSGAVIDVSGLTDATLPMSRNAVKVELRANELADAPLQRDSFLRGATVTVDVRKGTPLANVQGAIASVQRGLSERLSTGGNVVLGSEGDVVLADGARIDVSGGKVEYQTGVLDTTKLFSHGQVVDISNADPTRQYDGFASGYSVTYQRWGVTENFGGMPGDSGAQIEPGYVEGKDAGTVQIIAHDAVLAGDVDGHVVTGTWQRAPTGSLGTAPAFDRPYDQVPKAGSLVVDLGPAQSTIRNVVIDASGEPSDAAVLNAPDPNHQVHFASGLLAGGEFGSITITTNGSLTIASDGGLDLRPGTSITLVGGTLAIDGDIHATGGHVTLRGGTPAIGETAPMHIGEGVLIDASGGWINDLTLHGTGTPGTEPLYIDGGSIDVAAAGDLIVGPNAVFNVSGGAFYSSQRHLTAGKGGSISVASQYVHTSTQFILDAYFLGYGLDQGGSLSISGNEVLVGPDLAPQPLPPGPPPVDVQPPIFVGRSLFTNWGFENISLTANRGDLVIEPTTIAPVQRNLVLGDDFATRPTGPSLLSFASTTIKPADERRPVNLSFNVLRSSDLPLPDEVPAKLVMDAGATISLEPGARLAMTTNTQAIIAGNIHVPGGDVSLRIVPLQGDQFGYQRNQAVWLTPTASIDVSGTFVSTPNDLGLDVGTMYGGGTVELSAERGNVITLPGSLIDVSGFAKTVDVQMSDGTYRRIDDYRSAGSVDVAAAEGIFLEGSLEGRAPTAAAAGGTLSVVFDAAQRDVPAGDFTYSFGPRVLSIANEFAARDFQIGGNIAVNGIAEIPVESLAANGFDTLAVLAADTAGPTVVAPGAIDFVGDVTLALRDTISLNSGVVGLSGAVDLSAAYVALGHDAVAGSVERAFPAATGSLTAHADLIDIRGQLRIEGADQLSLASAGDMRLIGVLPDGQARELDGGLLTNANVTLTADQIYPSSLTHFRLDQRRVGGTVTILGGADDPTPVLSAGGSIEIVADNILQGGALKAPGGQIHLEAADQLRLQPGSLTSVSLEGATVLLGQTQGQLDWIYPLPNFRSIVFDGSVASALARTTQLPPEKSLSLQANSVVVQQGAVVDASGGGALLAYEFVPGPGGSKDTLTGSDGAFAIVPARAGAFGAYDTAIYQGFGGSVGDGIELAGIGAIPSGEFAVLPARFALLPGAFLVIPDDSGHNVVPGTAITGDDDIVTIAGRATRIGTPVASSTWSAFQVLTRDQVMQRSEFALNSADKFFVDRANRSDQPVPQLPADGGNLRFSVDTALEFLGVLRADVGTQGRRGTVDIEATNIRVAETADPNATDTVQITPDQLDALSAASLLLGGRRSQTAAGTQIDVEAQRVEVDAGAQLHAPDLIMVANDAISIGADALIQAVAAPTNDVPNNSIEARALSIAGDAALIRVTDQTNVVERTDVAGAHGDIDIGAGALLQASGAVQIDAPRDVALAGSVSVAGGTLAVGASRIAITDAPTGASGAVLTADQIAGSGAKQLLLRSGSSVDLGPVSLSLDRFAVNAAGLVAMGDGDATIAASEIDLGNSSGAMSDASVVARTAQLSLDADQWVLTGGAVALRGFQAVSASVADRIVAGADTTVSASGDLAATTPQVIAKHGARLSFDVAGDAALAAPPAAPATTATDDASLASLGGTIVLAAQHIDVDTHLTARGGSIALDARATDGAPLVVDAHGVLDAAGLDVTLGGRSVPVDAGSVALHSSAGAEIRSGAHIDVSGSAGGSDAGSVDVAVAGTLLLDGSLQAQHAASAQGGSIGVEQGGALVLDPLADLLSAGGFSRAISLAAGAGDLVLDAGHALAANRVRLVADAGSVEVGGSVQSSGSGGEVDLAARDGVTLHGGATIAAGDRVLVNVADAAGELHLETGSTISIANEGGEVRLRVVRGDVPIESRVTLDGALPTDRSTVLEAVAVVNQTSGVVTGADANAWLADANTFMSGASALVAALGESGNANFAVRPGIEVRTPGNLTLAQGWDLANARFDGAPGALTLRAGGTLYVQGDLSDGAVEDFDVLTGLPFDRLMTGASWDFTLVGGADLSSADVTRAKATGDVVVGAGVRVRTGTGDIVVSAGRDFVLADAGSTVYTMGRSTGAGPWPEIYRDLFLPKFEFPTDGGDMSIEAGRDVVGSKTTQLVSDWMVRVGGVIGDSNFPTTYGVMPGSFREGIGSLGGGSVIVDAARDVRDLSVELPVTAQHAGDVHLVDPNSTDVTFTDNTMLIQGGGDLTIRSGRDVIGGFAYLGRGEGSIRAGGAVRPEAAGVRGLLLGLADATIDVVATGSAHLESALNPTVLPEVNPYAPVGTFYFTYSPTAAVSVTSLAGDTVLGNDLLAIARSTNLNFTRAGGDRALNLYPGTVAAVSLQGDVRLGEPNARAANFALFPTQSGGLTLLAKGSVVAGDQAAVEVNVSDADPALLPNVDRVATSLDETLERIPQRGSAVQNPDLVHARVPVHTGDTTPSTVVAEDGDIVGPQLVFVFPEESVLSAGRDIAVNQVFMQNVSPNDVSVISAGRDVALKARRDPETGDVSNSTSVFRIAGPGRLDVIAGRNLDLGTSEGILSVGNLTNPALASDGATLTMLVGVAPGLDYAGFTDSIVLPNATYVTKLTTYMRDRLGDPLLGSDAAIAAFEAMPIEDQRPLLLDVFFAELKASGTDNAKDPTVGFDRGFAAIHALFPADRPYQGDFTLFFSRAQTQDGGDIDILVPGGLVNAGLTATFSGAKTPDQLGVVVQRTGDVNAFVRDDFQVNQSRVFALDGGSILIWSSDGNIDAGRGAKTALAAPQPKVTFDENGNVVVDFPPAISGSGIRNAVSTPGREPGDVFLIAPAGIVNAGDAGIGVAGNLIVAARQVVGTGNISVGGEAIGVTLDTGGLAAGLSNVSDAGASATTAAEQSVADSGTNTASTSMSQTALGWLEVFLEGYGDEQCDPQSDPKCRREEKTQ